MGEAIQHWLPSLGYAHRRSQCHGSQCRCEPSLHMHRFEAHKQCSSYVTRGHMTEQERDSRDYGFWTTFLLDTVRGPSYTYYQPDPSDPRCGWWTSADGRASSSPLPPHQPGNGRHTMGSPPAGTCGSLPVSRSHHERDALYGVYHISLDSSPGSDSPCPDHPIACLSTSPAYAKLTADTLPTPLRTEKDSQPTSLISSTSGMLNSPFVQPRRTLCRTF